MAKVISTYEVNDILESLTAAQSIIRNCYTKLETLGVAASAMETKTEQSKKTMKLAAFHKEYGIPPSTVRDMVHAKGFPAYKIGKCWYVDVDKFLKWREQENANNRRY